MHCNNRTKLNGLMIVSLVITVIGVVLCGYGYAATQTELLISGEATLKSSDGLIAINYMQEMTSSVCEASKVGDTKRLIDQRDGKLYWVAKMRDNRCWMNQNLALDITSDGLTSELSDINASSYANYETEEGANGEIIYKWTANSKNKPQATVIDAPFKSTSSAANDAACKSSATTADYVITRPTEIPTSATANKNTIAEFGDVVQDVTGWKPTYEYNSETGLSYDASTRTYDAHYLTGNYYSSGAATAGSLQRATNATGTSSICPKGWQLPAKTYYRTLLTAYGVPVPFASNNNLANDLAVNRTIVEPPLYFARFGRNGDSQYAGLGFSARYWANHVYSTHYNSGFVLRGGSTSTLIDSADTNAVAHQGHTVRCVAR